MIGYGSITLVDMEIRYRNSKLDYLALKSAVYGYYVRLYAVFIDNNLLLYAMPRVKLNATG